MNQGNLPNIFKNKMENFYCKHKLTQQQQSGNCFAMSRFYLVFSA